MYGYWGGPRHRVCWERSRQALRIFAARTFRQRLLGLHAWNDWGDVPWGLLFPGCRAVHTLGLRQPVDLLFLGAGGWIVRAIPELAPNRFAGCRAARAVLELPPGFCRLPDWEAQVSVGCRLWNIDA